MGLIKTSLTLAGGYALIKAASKAVNDHEDKKQRRSNQSQNRPQQGHSGHKSQMVNMQGNQTYHQYPQPQDHHGNNNAHNIRDSPRGFDTPINQSPPPYHRAGGQAGSAQEYYSGKKL